MIVFTRFGLLDLRILIRCVKNVYLIRIFQLVPYLLFQVNVLIAQRYRSSAPEPVSVYAASAVPGAAGGEGEGAYAPSRPIYLLNAFLKVAFTSKGSV